MPAEVRKKLGIGPGSLLEFEERGDEILVRRKGTQDFDDLHKRLFPNGPPPPVSVEEMDEGIARHIRKKFGWMRQPGKKG